MCRVAEACWGVRWTLLARKLTISTSRTCGLVLHTMSHLTRTVSCSWMPTRPLAYCTCSAVCVCVCVCVLTCCYQVLDARLGKQASNVVALRAAGWHEARTQEQALVAARRCMRGQPPARWRRQVGQARMQVAAALAVVHRERDVGGGGCEPGNRHCARGTGRCCFPRGVAEPVAPPAAAHAPA